MAELFQENFMPQVSSASSSVRGPRHHWSLYVLVAFFGGLLTYAGARAQTKATDDSVFTKRDQSHTKNPPAPRPNKQ